MRDNVSVGELLNSIQEPRRSGGLLRQKNTTYLDSDGEKCYAPPLTGNHLPCPNPFSASR